MGIIKSPTETKARKTYKCDFCSYLIDQGEVYIKSTLACDGEVYNWNTHKDCDEISIILKMYDHCHEGLTQDDFIENIHSEHERLMINLLPENELKKYSDIIEQLGNVIFRTKLEYVIRYYKKLNRNNSPQNSHLQKP